MRSCARQPFALAFVARSVRPVWSVGMLMVETELRASAIHGIGVFLTQRVGAGDLIWRFDSRIDRVFSDDELEEMPQHLRQFLRTYSTLHGNLGLWVLCGDNGRHFNHSDSPNTRSLGVAFGDDVAAEDIEPGTELTSDYRTICDAVRLSGVNFSHPPHDARSTNSSTQFLERVCARETA
ncbi:MAG: SET domain-containing protein [Sphingomicrobium sp.]